jgi:DNA-binding MarR family transcriptional regulator
METGIDRTNEHLRQLVDTFWETFPPFWHLIRGHIRQVAADQFEISVEQFHILRLIRRGLVTASQLAEVKNISRPAISQAVDALVKKGLIVRRRATHDRRNIELTLTENGDALLDALFDDTRQWMMQIFSPLSNSELQALIVAIDSLRKIQTL